MVNQARLICSRCTHTISSSVLEEAFSSIRESATEWIFKGDFPKEKRLSHLLTTTVAMVFLELFDDNKLRNNLGKELVEMLTSAD